MAGERFTIGADPEFFLRRIADGQLISAIPFIPGTKDEPHMLPSGGGLQWDNVLVEVASPVAEDGIDFVKKLAVTIQEMKAAIPDGTELVPIPSAQMPPEELKTPEACMFGCDPDFDAWDVAQNDPPFCSDETFRSAGAHIHLGTNGEDGNEFLLEFQGKIDTIKLMDCVHGIVFTVLDNSSEAIARRQLYGKPGSHRPKDYGVEYRALSNMWLRSPVTVMLVYHLSHDVLRLVREGRTAEIVDAMDSDHVKQVIMEGLEDDAMRLVEDHLMGLLSPESINYFQQALAKVRDNDMDFNAEWTDAGIKEAIAA
jgi:hypothetical protein